MIIGGGLMNCPPSHALPQLMGKIIYIYVYIFKAMAKDATIMYQLCMLIHGHPV